MQTGILLEMAAGSFPGRPVLGERGAPLTAEALDHRVRRAAGWLALQETRHVVFMGLNGPLFPILLFASARAGCPLIPLNYRLPDAELTTLLGRTGPAVAIIDDDMLARVSPPEDVRVVARSDFEAMLDAAGTPVDQTDREDDVALMLFTSGTSGAPKKAILRHRHLTSYVISTVEFMGAGEEEAALVSVPPYHIAGVSAVLSNLWAGRRVVYMPAFDAKTWVATVRREGITHAMLVPTMLHKILSVLGPDDSLPSLRALSYGGGRMPLPVIEEAVRRLPQVAFVNAYGLTETSSTISVLGPEDHREALASSDPGVRRRLGSVGRPLPSVELQIRAADGKALAPGEVGEVCVRGEQVSGEYSAGSVLDPDGWFATRDAGWLDEDGYLFVEGRLDDVIVRGGENISPGEIEDVLRLHPGVEDVAILGLPDVQWGERIGAVIVARDSSVTAEGLRAWVQPRLRSTRTPEVWVFRDQLPYNETGKLVRRLLRAELAG